MLTLRAPTRLPDEAVILCDVMGNPSAWAMAGANPIGADRTARDFLDPIPGGVTHLIAWSGTLDDDLFGRANPMTWIGPGREALGAFVADIAQALRDRGVRLLLRPHCRHVLGDATTARSYLGTLDPAMPVGVALDIAAVFEPDMLRAAADHCRRTFEILGPIAECVICTGAVAEGESVRATPLGEGPLDWQLLAELYGEHCRPGTPVALLEERFEDQLVLLGQSPA
jgi:hypothetical protein